MSALAIRPQAERSISVRPDGTTLLSAYQGAGRWHTSRLLKRLEGSVAHQKQRDARRQFLNDRSKNRLAREANVTNELKTVGNGSELLDYLRHRGEPMPPARSPRPNRILLDLNMPQMDGCETLLELKSDPDLRSIPVVILNTSRTSEDLTRTYDLGTNSFVVKPVTFDGLVRAMKVSVEYWSEWFSFPRQPRSAHE